MAGAVETTVATRLESSAATALRQTAERVSRTFAPCERSCLDIGARLGDAIPVLSDLSGLFQELSKSLESEELRAAGLDLQTVSDQIEVTANDLSEESQALADLVALNHAIAERIANLSDSGRTISMLVFNVKIEAASLSGLGEDMRGFVEGLHELAARAQQALNQYRLTHGKLYDLLRASSEAQKRFQDSHQARLLSIAGEVAASLAAVGERRRETAGALAEIGARSQRIGAQIGQCVMALQVGDSTCQRIEHVRAALHIAAQGLEPGATDDAWSPSHGVPDLDSRCVSAPRFDPTAASHANKLRRRSALGPYADQHLRRWCATGRANGQCLDRLTLRECTNCFEAAGYEPT